MVALQGQELVAHVFVRASGQDAAAGHRYVLDLWHRCCERFALDEAVAAHPRRPPAELAPTAAAGGVLAARGAAGAGVHQIVLRRLREVLVLSVILAPPDVDSRGWPELEDDWDAVARPPAAGVIGAARILQARLAHPTADVDPAVARSRRRSGDRGGGAWSTTGVLRATAPLGPFAVWEADPPGAAGGPGHPRRAPDRGRGRCGPRRPAERVDVDSWHARADTVRPLPAARGESPLRAARPRGRGRP